MDNNNFDLFEGIELSEEQKQYLEITKKVSDIIVEMIKRRVELKMSQRDLAEASGIKQPMIARIESMDTTPRIDTLLRLATSLGMSLSFSDEINVIVNVHVTQIIEYHVQDAYTYSYEPVDYQSKGITYQA